MSESKKAPEQSYISRVRLQGYKSIIDTEVELKPGLNIIIGANGSGKTNFVEFLKFALASEFDKISERFSSIIEANIHNKLLKHELNYKLFKNEGSPKLIPIKEEKLFINGELQKKLPIPIWGHPEWGLLYPFYITYSVPVDFQVIANLTKVEFNVFVDYEGTTIHISRYQEPFFTFGLQALLQNIFLENDSIFREKELFLDEMDFIPLFFKDNLNKFSAVKNIRLLNSFTITYNEDSIEIDYIKFEFYVNDKWLTWNQLSDGTKRLFYIITEITFANNIVIIEEPELGIHPHQLARLMDFIKEQSETKQIILTTHSPEVLNTLGRDELDRIIVARYDKEKGTQLRHLSEDDIKFAKDYMKNELFLSDYWVMSGFETEEENV